MLISSMSPVYSLAWFSLSFFSVSISQVLLTWSQSCVQCTGGVFFAKCRVWVHDIFHELFTPEITSAGVFYHIIRTYELKRNSVKQSAQLQQMKLLLP